MLHRYHSLYHVLDLDGKLSCRAQNQADCTREHILNIRRLLVEFLDLADAKVQDWDAKTQSLSLARPRSDNHIDM